MHTTETNTGLDISRRQRRTPQERLDAALRKMNSLQTKIQQIRTAIDAKSRKERTRQLIIAGVVLEQLLMQGAFANSSEHPPAWWFEQVEQLTERDKAAWISFLNSLDI